SFPTRRSSDLAFLLRILCLLARPEFLRDFSIEFVLVKLVRACAQCSDSFWRATSCSCRFRSAQFKSACSEFTIVRAIVSGTYMCLSNSPIRSDTCCSRIYGSEHLPRPWEQR